MMLIVVFVAALEEMWEGWLEAARHKRNLIIQCPKP